jgi:RND superfamily putative drug exporter
VGGFPRRAGVAADDNPGREPRPFGLGLAVAVLLDAAVIRCLIVPSVMRLLGTRAWWLPRVLDRVLPVVALEREQPQPEPDAQEDAQVNTQAVDSLR